jgi:4-amino-4-deoxychorismate lyase
MCQFIETIRIENKMCLQLELHERRFKNTRRAFFGDVPFIDLASEIKLPESLTQKVYKCRIVYSSNIESITFDPYIIKNIQSLQLIEDDFIDYTFKFEDRSMFNQYLIKKLADDILIIKNGFITDTSFSNIVFFDGTKWITPSTYLLNGTQRQRLLQQGAITEAQITPTDLKYFRFAKLINAMLDLESSPVINLNVII